MIPLYFEKSTLDQEPAFFPRKQPPRTENSPRTRDNVTSMGKELPESPAPSPAAALSRDRAIPRKKDSEQDRISGSFWLACLAVSFVGFAVILEKPRRINRQALKKTGTSMGRKGLRREPETRETDRIPEERAVIMKAEGSGIFTCPAP